MSFGINFPALLFFPRLIRFKVCQRNFLIDGLFRWVFSPVPTNPHESNNINQGCTWRAVSMAGWTDSRNGTQKKDKKQKEKNPAQFPRSKSAKGADETFLPTCHTTRHIEKGIFKQKETRHFLFLFFFFWLLGPNFWMRWEVNFTAVEGRTPISTYPRWERGAVASLPTFSGLVGYAARSIAVCQQQRRDFAPLLM